MNEIQPILFDLVQRVLPEQGRILMALLQETKEVNRNLQQAIGKLEEIKMEIRKRPV